jgi:hypothetical protein
MRCTYTPSKVTLQSVVLKKLVIVPVIVRAGVNAVMVAGVAAVTGSGITVRLYVAAYCPNPAREPIPKPV